MQNQYPPPLTEAELQKMREEMKPREAALHAALWEIARQRGAMRHIYLLLDNRERRYELPPALMNVRDLLEQEPAIYEHYPKFRRFNKKTGQMEGKPPRR